MFYSSNTSILLFSFLMLPSFFTHAIIPAGTPLIIHNHNHNDIKPIINNTPTITTTMVTQSIQELTFTYYERIKETFTENNFTQLKKLIATVAWEKRYNITGGLLLSTYGSISLLLLADYNFLNDSSLWARWKPECSFIDLCAIPSAQLEKELVHSIAQRHCNKNNPTDLSMPLITFINSIDHEIERVNRYIRTALAIKRCHLMKIFPINDTKIENARKLLERAHFVRHLFLSWLANYNLTSR